MGKIKKINLILGFLVFISVFSTSVFAIGTLEDLINEPCPEGSNSCTPANVSIGIYNVTWWYYSSGPDIWDTTARFSFWSGAGVPYGTDCGTNTTILRKIYNETCTSMECIVEDDGDVRLKNDTSGNVNENVTYEIQFCDNADGNKYSFEQYVVTYSGGSPNFDAYIWQWGVSGCEYPNSGNWNISEDNNTYCYNQIIRLNGNLSIYGNLTFKNVTLIMNLISDGQNNITVYDGGNFTIRSQSNLTSNNSDYEFPFWINSGSIFEMKDSYLSEHYSLKIETDNVTIENNTIYNAKDYSIFLLNSNNNIIVKNNLNNSKFANSINNNISFNYITEKAYTTTVTLDNVNDTYFNNNIVNGTNNANVVINLNVNNLTMNNNWIGGSCGDPLRRCIQDSGKIYNSIISNNNITQCHGSAIVFTDGSNITIFNNKIYDFGSDSLVSGINVRSNSLSSGFVNITNNNITNNFNGMYGIVIGDDNYGTQNWYVENNYLNNATFHKWRYINAPKGSIHLFVINNSIIKNNTILNAYRGIYIELWRNKNITIYNNTILNHSGYGIFCYVGEDKSLIDTNISNNYLENNDNAIKLYTCNNLTFENNSIIKSGDIFSFDSNFTKFINMNISYRTLNLTNSNVTALNLTFFNITTNFYAEDVAIKNNVTYPPPDSNGLENISIYLNITNTSSNGYTFMNISYNESELGNVTEEWIRLYKYNGTNWVIVSGSGININEDYVYGNLTSFSIFAPMGGPDPIVITRVDRQYGNATLGKVLFEQNVTSNNTIDSEVLNYNVTADIPLDGLVEPGNWSWFLYNFSPNEVISNITYFNYTSKLRKSEGTPTHSQIIMNQSVNWNKTFTIWSDILTKNVTNITDVNSTFPNSTDSANLKMYFNDKDYTDNIIYWYSGEFKATIFINETVMNKSTVDGIYKFDYNTSSPNMTSEEGYDSLGYYNRLNQTSPKEPLYDNVYWCQNVSENIVVIHVFDCTNGDWTDYSTCKEITANESWSIKTFDQDGNGKTDRVCGYTPELLVEKDVLIQGPVGKEIETKINRRIINLPLPLGDVVHYEWNITFINQNPITIYKEYKLYGVPINAQNIRVDDVTKSLSFDEYGAYVTISITISPNSNITVRMLFDTPPVSGILNYFYPEKYWVGKDAQVNVSLKVTNWVNQTIPTANMPVWVGYAKDLKLKLGNQSIQTLSLVEGTYNVTINDITPFETRYYYITYKIPTAKIKSISEGRDPSTGNNFRTYSIVSISNQKIDTLWLEIEDIECVDVLKIIDTTTGKELLYKCGSTEIFIGSIDPGPTGIKDITVYYLETISPISISDIQNWILPGLIIVIILVSIWLTLNSMKKKIKSSSK